ncbi:PMEI domain-containing protein [Cephalotus follicularis]|uniref:PMEI domain-containing protein n=1 Tax=Cephalotus follicularis TaxID=3775 RepID=A0A1Q3CSG4_CEPFO|nr:PMEI domain-containing protein [Cephalotus follicularis]GAV83626.1 PMEI domain-containing protein [Cephalotus follicularis]
MELYKSILLLISLPAILTFSAEACAPRMAPSPAPSSQFLPLIDHLPPAPSPISESLSSVDHPIQKVCKVTSHPTECVTAILPLFNGHTDPISVLMLEIQALANQTRQSIDKATEISEDSSTSSLTVTCLKTCIDMYQTAIDDLQSALDAIAARDRGTLNSFLSAVYTDIDTCSDTFAEQDDLVSPMDETDMGLKKLSANNLDIATVFVHF